MKIRILYSVDIIFRYAAHAWNNYFNQHGHESICIHIYTDKPGCYQDTFAADINLIIGCAMLFKYLDKHGYPESGKHVLWMLDPLTHESTYHRDKIQAFEAIDNRFDAVVGMNEQITRYFSHHCPSISLIELPYVLDQKRIMPPMEEHQKLIDILLLGRRTEKRDAVVKSLHAAGLNVNYIHYDCWGMKRRRALANTKLLLQVSMDEHVYFDQFRLFEGYAHGAMAVGHWMPDMDKYGFEHGTHIMISDIDDIPHVCDLLLSDDALRSKIIHNAQSHIRQTFTVDQHGPRLLAFFADVLTRQ